jgi:RNA polymerase sigma factor (sigma-70 family)
MHSPDVERLLGEFAASIQQFARMLHRRIGDPSLDANDYAQELVIHVYRSLDRFDEARGSLSAFVLWRIRGKAKMLLRASCAKRRLFCKRCASLDAPATETRAATPLLRDTIADPHPHLVDRHSFRADVEQEIAALSPAEVQVCLLARCGLSTTAMARVTGMSRKRVASLFRSVRNRLRLKGLHEYL